MNCRETLPLLPLFLDGELDARQMRGVALHSTRCTTCENELRRTERLQDAVVDYVSACVEDADLSQVWAAVEPQLRRVSRPWFARVRGWRDALDEGWRVRVPVFGAVAATIVLAVAFWPSAEPRPDPSRVASAPRVDNSAILASVESDVDSLVLLSEPETNTMVLWVNEEGVLGAEDLGGAE